MNKYVRFLAGVLAAALAVSVFTLNTVITVSAETESLMVCACDTTDGWTKVNAAANNPLSVTTVRAQAQSDDGAIAANTGYGFFQAYYEFPEAVDVSDYTAIEWDVFYGGANGINEVLSTYATAGYLRIFSNGNSPTNNQSNSLVFRFDDLEVTAINVNWAHLKATFENARVKRNFDPTALTAFRFYTSENSYINTVANGAMRLDNIMVTGKEVTELPETVTVTDCETLSGWASESPSNANLQLASGRGKGGTNAVYATGGYGALRKLTYTLAAPLNTSSYSTIEWDMQSIVNVSGNAAYGNDQFADIAAAYSSSIGIELSDGTNTAKLGFDSWQTGDAGADKYRHFAASFAGAAIDLTAVTSVSIYVLPLGGGSVDTSVLNAFFRIDNIIVSNNAVTPNSYDYVKITELLLEDCEDAAGWSLNNNPSSGNMTVNNNGVTGKAIQAFGANGAVYPLKYTFTDPVNISRHGYIDFDVRFLRAGGADDMWPIISEKYANTIKVTLTDNDGNYFDYNLPKLGIGEPNANNWYKFTLSLNRAAKSGLDFSKIKSFTVLISTVADSSVGSNMNMRVDNIRALPKKDLTAGDVNGDEAVDVKDLMRIKRSFIGEDVEVFEEFADIYVSGTINAQDFTGLQMLILGFNDALPSYSLLSTSGWSGTVKP